MGEARYAFEKAVAAECTARVRSMAEGQAMMYEQGGVSVEPVQLATRLGNDPEMMGQWWQQGEHVWGTALNDYDVETVRRYRVGWR